MKKEKMPVLFIGHGSPMNAIEENDFTDAWKDIAKLKRDLRKALSGCAVSLNVQIAAISRKPHTHR